MKVIQGGKPRPRWGTERRKDGPGRCVRGVERRRYRVNLRIRESIVRATTGLPGVKPDRVYNYRSGRRLPADRYIQTLEQLQDVGAPTLAIVPQLDAIREHLESRERTLAEIRDLAA